MARMARGAEFNIKTELYMLFPSLPEIALSVYVMAPGPG